MSRKYFTIVLSAVAVLAFGLAATAQAEMVFKDTFNDTADPTSSNGYALNDSLAARQADGTLGTINWSRDKRTGVSGQESFIQVNNSDSTWGADVMAYNGNGTNYSGHAALLDKNFNTGTYAAKIAAGHGFTIRFDIDPVSYASATNQHGYGAGVFIGALDATESNIPSAPSTVIAGRNDPKVDLAIHLSDSGLLYLFHYGTLTGSTAGVTFDTARAAENTANPSSYAKVYTFELRVTADNFNSGTTASATVWWGAQGTASGLLTQATLGTTAGNGISDDLKTYTWTWDGDSTAGGGGFIGFHNYQTNGTRSQFDNVEIHMIPEPSTLALLATGLVGLLAYAWRKRK